MTSTSDPQVPSALEQAFAQVEVRVWNTIQRAFLHEGESLPAQVFHYTSAQAFYGVLRDKQIWATDSRQLGDPMEGKYADELFADIINREIVKPTTSVVGLLAGELRNRRVKQRSSPYFDSRLFVASFSRWGNDLGQWRMYGDDGRGFSIGILTKRLKPLNADWVKVIYDESRQTALMYNLLGVMGLEVLSFASANAKSVADVVSLAADAIERIVQKLKPFFKHKAYESEAEWRLARVVHYPYCPEIQVRTRGHSIISYSPIPIVDADGFIPLGKTYFGPAQDPDWPTAFDVLRVTGHYRNDTFFEVSGLPYRSSAE